MKPAPFRYYAPRTIDEALAHLAEHGWDAKVLAGGQSLIPMMNLRLAQPSVLVDLNNVFELPYNHRTRDAGVGIYNIQFMGYCPCSLSNAPACLCRRS